MKKFPIKLVVSDRMSSRGGDEDNFIRLPRRARAVLNFEKDMLKIGGGKNSLVLKLREAYKEDLRATPLNERESVGFLTRKNYNIVVPEDNNDSLWLTEDEDPIMIGCDPEFILEENGVLVPAYTVLTHTGKFGSDHLLAELRPDPSQDINKLVENIRKLLKKPPSNKVAGYDWVGGAWLHDRSIGGHIHIGSPRGIYKEDEMVTRRATRLFKVLAAVLDDYITAPMTRIDRPDAIERRKHPRHGGYCNIRTDHAGRLEWRTLSGYWLVHPRFAEAILGATKAISETFWKRLPKEEEIDEILRCIDHEDNNKVLSNFDLNFITETKKIILNNKISRANLERRMKRFKYLEFYSEYRTYIDDFVEITRLSEDELEGIGLELKSNWL